jgi:UDP-2,3-diacylglucosamine hydrolase
MADPGPAISQYRAPPAWRAIDFLSDLHLSAAMPRTFAALETHLRCTDADAVFILGDLFEAWVGDDARHEGFEAECTAMLAEASRQRVIGFMAGNRDFLVGEALLGSAGLVHLHDPTLMTAFGRQLLLSHGDALCLDDREYQAFRREVRGPQWQQRFLSQPLAARKELARHIRDESHRRKTRKAPADWADVDADEAARWLRMAGANELVHGHTHLPGEREVAPGLVRHVLSDWDMDHGRPSRADVLRWTSQGLARMAPVRAC